MKYAKSLSRLGELIEANTADYSTFKDLLLVCPHCSSSVYLVQTHTRQAGSRQLADRVIPVAGSTVPAYFKHHGSEDLDCEIYNQKIGSDRIIQSLAIARNQRADIFRSRFLDIFKTSSMIHVQSHFTVREIEKNIKSVRREGVIACQVPATLSLPKTTLNFSLERIVPIINHCLEWPFHDWGKSFLHEELAGIYEEVSVRERVGVFETQAKYTSEALGFLFARSNRRLLIQVLLMVTIEITCLMAVNDARAILHSPKFFDRDFDRDAGIKTMVRMLEEDLLQDLSAPMYLQQGRDIGIKLPIVSTIATLMTIDWEKEFQKYIKGK